MATEARVPALLTKQLQRLLDRDVVLDARERSERANRFFPARNVTEVTNLLGLIFDWQPLEDATADNIHNRLLFNEADCRKHLQPVVARMRSYHFNCLPMMMVTEKAGAQLTWMVRVLYNPDSKCAEPQIDYIDPFLRRYESFEQFLESNRLPACTLYYPRQGRVQYDYAHDGQLLVDGRKIVPDSQVLRHLATISSVSAMALALTPLGGVTAAVVAVGMNIPSLGFAINDLVDGVKHEKASTVALRATLLTVNVMSFAQVGLVAGCKVARLRGLLTPEKLKLLETAERVVTNINKFVAPTAVATCVLLVSRSDWDGLSSQEQLLLAANLCLAFRELVSLATAQRLMQLCNRLGLVRFFQTTCKNLTVGYDRLRILIEPYVEPMMRFMMEYLEQNISFTVDDDFGAITIFGYKLSVPKLFSLDESVLLEVIKQLRVGYMAAQQTFKSVNEALATKNLLSSPGLPLDVINAVIELCSALRSLRDAAVKLAESIRFGNGHTFTMETLLAWWHAPAHDRIPVLRALVALERDQTEQLNVLRSTKRLKDEDLFRWLAISSKERYIPSLLDALLDVAKRIPRMPLVFDDEQRIVIDELLAIGGNEYNGVSIGNRDVLLHDRQFLRLCRDASTDPSLFELGRQAWVRTCSQQNPQFETIDLLSALMGAGRLPLTLAQALNYTLPDIDATVAKVYYGTLFACQVFNWTGSTAPGEEQLVTLRARFAELVTLVESKYRMVGFKRMQIPETTSDGADGLSDEEVIALARTLLSCPDENPISSRRKQAPVVPFGPAERAALWLHFVPALRHPDGRQQILTTITDLLANGEGQLIVDERNGTVRCDTDGAYMVMFYRGAAKIILELIPTDYGDMRGSIYLCSMKATAVKWNPKPSGTQAAEATIRGAGQSQ
ncbi:uncharacterized protein LOC118468489 [Anopheles albimanus]|uniref:uncharacterized protein LOC118468489 n=1 Tax=Anopheles albimanus TaxID=7167 RepID=UPI00163E1D22|nr:uncharacterized protein LOC118468489 [Anopheles albimanus]